MSKLAPTRLPEDFRQYPGKWVAIEDGQIVAVRATPDELVEVLDKQGRRGATVMRVPTEHDKELVGLG